MLPEEKTVQVPSWKYVYDANAAGKMTAVLDVDAPIEIEKHKVLYEKKNSSKNTSVCPTCQKDAIVVEAIKARERDAMDRGAHSGLASETFTRDKAGRPAKSDNTFRWIQ